MPEVEDLTGRLIARLKLRHLELLLSIQRHGSLTRVAQHAATSQSAVTHALSEIEGLFGAPLFERSSRGMTPTPIGEVVLRRSQWLMTDLAHMANEVETVKGGFSAHLNLGVIPFVSGAILSRVIRRVNAQTGSKLTVTIHEGSSEQLMASMRNHDLDFMIGRAAAMTMAPDIRHEVLYHQQPSLIASRQLADSLPPNRPDWARMAGLDWILGAPNTPIREQVNGLFVRAGITPPEPVVQSYSSKLIGEMIASSDRALSVVPADIAAELERIAGIVIVPYALNWKLPPIALFNRADAPMRDIDHLFSKALRSVCQDGDDTLSALPLF